MTPREELTAWNAAAAAVLERDIQQGTASANPDAPERESPLLGACMDARETLEQIVHGGGHWQGRWVEPERWRPRQTHGTRGPLVGSAGGRRTG